MPNNAKYKIWWDQDNDIVRAIAVGVLDEHEALGILEATKELAKDHGNEIDWLVDLCQMTKATSHARKILAEATGHVSIHKYAFVGASIYVRTIANFIAAAAGQKNTRHFATEKDAMKWLEEGKKDG